MSLDQRKRIALATAGAVLVVLSFATHWSNVTALVVFAGVGLLMQQYKWPRLPLWFGLAIGSTIERLGHTAWALADSPTGLLARPFVLGIVALVLAAAVAAYLLSRSEAAPLSKPRFEGLLKWQSIAPALGIVIGVVFLWGSLGFRDTPAVFLPRVAGMATVMFCLLELALSTREPIVREHRETGGG